MKLHKVRAHMRRSPAKPGRSPTFYATTEALRQCVVKQKRIRVKAVSYRVTG